MGGILLPLASTWAQSSQPHPLSIAPEKWSATMPESITPDDATTQKSAYSYSPEDDPFDASTVSDDDIRQIMGDPNAPDYVVRAYRAQMITGDNNVKRFAEAASEFQRQEIRDRLSESDEIPENADQLRAAVSTAPSMPYVAVGQTGYVLNRVTGELLAADSELVANHKRQIEAKAEKGEKNMKRYRDLSRLRDTVRSRERRHGQTAMLTKEEYERARDRAVTTQRPDIVKELDRMAVTSGLIP